MSFAKSLLKRHPKALNFQNQHTEFVFLNLEFPKSIVEKLVWEFIIHVMLPVIHKFAMSNSQLSILHKLIPLPEIPAQCFENWEMPCQISTCPNINFVLVVEEEKEEDET